MNHSKMVTKHKYLIPQTDLAYIHKSAICYKDGCSSALIFMQCVHILELDMTVKDSFAHHNAIKG